MLHNFKVGDVVRIRPQFANYNLGTDFESINYKPNDTFIIFNIKTLDQNKYHIGIWNDHFKGHDAVRHYNQELYKINEDGSWWIFDYEHLEPFKKITEEDMI